MKALALGLEGTRQDQEKTRLEVVDQVRRAYYAVVEAQSALDSLQASLPYYQESHRLALENRGKETILESDLLNADAQLLKIQNAISDASDRVASASERLNDLMGRDIHTQFRVAAIGDADTDLATPEAMEARALQNRPDVKKAKLQVQQADYDARAKKAEYIPDVSLAFNYYTTANFENVLPSNIGTVGLSLRWEPWDWGRRHQEYAGKASERRAGQGWSRRYGTRRSSGGEKCVPAIGEHPPATGPERCKRTCGPAEAQRGAGAGEARSGIKQRFVSSTVGSGFRRQPAATSSHCVLEGQSRFEKSDWRRMMRISVGILSFAALSVLAGCGTKTQKAGPEPVPVQAETVAMQQVQPSWSYSGEIRPDTEVQLAFKEPGYIAALYRVKGADGRMRDVQVGDEIPAGAVLAHLRRSDYEASLNSAVGQQQRDAGRA